MLINCDCFLSHFHDDNRLIGLLINEAKGERVTIPCSFVAFVLHNGLQNDHGNYSLLTALSLQIITLGNFLVVWNDAGFAPWRVRPTESAPITSS